MIRCPGQDQRFWKPKDIFEVECPQCGELVEFFKDEPNLKCRKCGQMVINPRIDLGCAEWCQYAKLCLGTPPKRGPLGVSTASRENFIRDKLINEMKKVFGKDQRRIDHALAVLDYAEQIQTVEGGDPLVVKAAAILHDIGIQEAERKYGSSEGKYQEIEGPVIAKQILQGYNIPPDTIEHICKIIANHHTAREIDTTEFRIIWDADWLVNMQEAYRKKGSQEDFISVDRKKLQEIIDKTFKTQKGRLIARQRFVKNQNIKK